MEHFEQLYANKCDDLGEMKKNSLERQKLPKKT